MAAELLRSCVPCKTKKFKGDRYRYQKEAAQYYPDAVASFITELLQNALDACSKTKVPMEMKVRVFNRKEEVQTFQRGNKIKMVVQNRVVVTFEDNGTGMNEEIIEEGLLRIAGSADTRTDAGSKSNLGNGAGGFGLAKVLLFLGQDGFSVCTKMKDAAEVSVVTAAVDREDQEHVEFRSFNAGGLPCTMFRPGDASHGTFIEIVLNPWVMALLREARYSNDPAGFVRDLSYQHDKADAIADKFRAVLKLSHLPVNLTLNGEHVPLDHKLGDFKEKVKLGFTQRECASIYAMPGKNSSMPVVLQVLPDMTAAKNTKEPARAFFLFVFEKTVDASNHLPMMPSLMLQCRDQHDKEFTCAQLLTGQRSDLAREVNRNAMPLIHQLLRDPSTFLPPARVIALHKQPQGEKSFSETWSDYIKREVVSKPYSWWANLTKEQATEKLGGPWREKLQYQLFLNREEGVKDGDLAPAFGAGNLDGITARQIQQLEIYGAFVHQILDIVQDELPSGVGLDFDLGFHFSYRALTMTGDCYDVRAARVAQTKRPLFVLNPVNGPELPDHDLTAEKIWKSVIDFRSTALHEVAHTWIRGHDGDFHKKMMELRDKLDWSEQQEGAWTWFNIYKRALVRRFYCDVQDGNPRSRELVDHLFSLQAPNLTSMERIHREQVDRELKNIGKLIKNGTCPNVAVANCNEPFVPMTQQIQHIRLTLEAKDDEAKLQQEENERLQKEMATLKKEMQKEKEETLTRERLLKEIETLKSEREEKEKEKRCHVM